VTHGAACTRRFPRSAERRAGAAPHARFASIGTRARAAGTALAVACVAPLAAAQSQSEDEALARQLANPVASLISIPFQNNWDRGIGPAESGRRYTMNVQPVVPFDLNSDWNLIARVILPVVSQQDVFPGAGGQSGLGDTVASLFFSPKRPTESGWIWGAGPVFLLPTGTDDLLTTKKWGLGPTGVALRQDGQWTYGALANHVWSVAGSSSRPDVSTTFVQPFAAYTTPTAWSFVLQAEATYDWERKDASVPVGVFVGKVLRIGGLPVQVVGGPRYYVSHFDNGPRGWGARLSVVLMLPR
jgi:hypothetical protein